jgi:hypothetical protein
VSDRDAVSGQMLRQLDAFIMEGVARIRVHHASSARTSAVRNASIVRTSSVRNTSTVRTSSVRTTRTSRSSVRTVRNIGYG